MLYQEIPNSNLLNCETEGVVGTSEYSWIYQANEVLKNYFKFKGKII